jgi:CheY-like chemotaxis protein
MLCLMLTSPPSTGRTILAVHHVQDQLVAVASLFGNAGHRVLATLDAKEAIQLALDSRPDLILSEACMPVANGFDLIKVFKANLALREIPFVLITSTASRDETRAKGLALGAAKILFQPIDPSELLAEIESCLAPKGRP